MKKANFLSTNFLILLLVCFVNVNLFSKDIFKFKLVDQFFPFYYKNNKGEYEGLIFSILDKWAKDNNADIMVEHIDNLNESEIEDEAIYLGLTYNVKLNDFFYFKSELARSISILFFKNSNKKYKNTHSTFLSNFNIGVIKNTIYEDILRLKNVNTIFLADNSQELVLALKNDKVDYIYGDCKTLHYIANNFLSEDLVIFTGDVFYSIKNRVAISRNAPEIVKNLNLDLFSYLMKMPEELVFSFLDSNAKGSFVDVGLYNDYPPLSFINSQGKLSGILVDLWNLLSRQHIFKPIFKGFSKEDIKKSLDGKSVGIFGGIISNDSVLENVNYVVSKPIYPLNFKFYSKDLSNDAGPINSQFIDFNFNNIQLNKNKDIVNNFIDIVNNSYGFIENSITTKYLLKLNGYNGRLKSYDSIFNKNRFLVLAIDNRIYKVIKYILNSIFDDISFESLLQIDKNWLDKEEINSSRINSYKIMNKVKFNIEEKIWLSKNNKLNLAVKNWYPIDYVEANNYKGINQFLLDKIRMFSGLRFNIIKVHSSLDLKKLIKSGKIDMLNTNATDSNLDNVFNIKLNSRIPLYIFSNKKRVLPSRSLEKFAILDFLYSKNLASNIKSKLILVSSFNEALLLLYKGKVDGIISDEYTAAAVFEELNIDDVEKIPTFRDLAFDLSLAIYNQDYILKEIIQKVVMRSNVDSQMYLNDWKFDIYYKSRSIRFKNFKFLVITFIIFYFTFLGFVIIFMFRLSFEQKRRYSFVMNEKKIAEAANAAKTIFIANVSHDIRTPINGIMAATELLDTTILTDVQKDYVRMINYSSDSLLSLIDDILYLSKIDVNELYVESQEIDLESEMEMVLKAFQSQCAKKNIDLFSYSKSIFNNYIKGDIVKIKQVLINLIGNAFKFTDDGVIVLNYEEVCRTRTDGNRVLVTVEFKVIDTGKGIEKENFSKIFEIFKQEDDSSSRVHEGAGLGLSISRELIRLMGGLGIAVDSKVGEGTTFSFMLPFLLGSELKSKKLSINRFQSVNGDNKVLNVLLSQKSIKIFEHCSILLGCSSNVRYVASFEDAYKVFKKYPSYNFVYINVNNDNIQEGIRLANNIERLNSDVQIIFLFYYLDNKALKNLKYGYVKKPLMGLGICSILYKKEFNPEMDFEDLVPIDSALRIKEPINVLIAEDNQVNQKVLKDILVVIGINENFIDVVDDGVKALKSLKDKKYTISFIDIRMPRYDGFSVAKEIRKFEKAKNLKPCVLVAVTAHALQEYKDKCLASGMNDYISKPIHISSIKTILKKYLQFEVDDIGENEDLNQLVKFPNLDVNRALKELNLSYVSYSELCRGLVDFISINIIDLEKAFDEEDLSLIKDISHSISGALSNMRSELYKDFQKIETSKDSISELKKMYSFVKDDLFQLISDIKENILFESEIVSENKLYFKNNDQFLNLLNKLLIGIKTRKPREYKEILESINKYVLDDNIQVLFSDLRRNLRLYRFAESSKILEEIIEMLNNKRY
ncbi:response regulator [Borreliella burgdorferi]|uniref:histidine kinase n=1 Tax=Borreliella burgdorferi (strain ZS7) TaxID=445985 RepID=A0A0H3C4F5_BORBZ|nr:transporter substrate-binding domain-containing protein [Borreliella burgdorferi]ACK74842.1 putative sensory transduction histidine kinase [Borreliella burgdorferi ZS7]EEH31675.1 putative sensory transduction histidine kinase [Borreliella burgdorferi Bol26]MCD2379960.1 response regulator [Borreliella burgdorferi]MCS2181548.1 response regulator [Borreliella burgdorferi]PRR17864.1 histidine kinase [Borreliella burgdorferi]